MQSRNADVVRVHCDNKTSEYFVLGIFSFGLGCQFGVGVVVLIMGLCTNYVHGKFHQRNRFNNNNDNDNYNK